VERVDVVYDPVGLVDKSLKCLKQNGRILLIGFAGREGNMERIAMNRVLLRQAQIIGYVSSQVNFREERTSTDDSSDMA
jgi:NADPH:quinone reductase-like Zn-dependent oxidoreductase